MSYCEIPRDADLARRLEYRHVFGAMRLLLEAGWTLDLLGPARARQPAGDREPRGAGRASAPAPR